MMVGTDGKYHLALIGCGDISTTYIKAALASKSVRIAKLMDINEGYARALSNEYNLPWTTSYQDVLEDREIYGVIICTPHYLHYPMAKQAAEAGKHILCEKPISTNIPDAEKMIEVCRQKGVSLSINYALRFTDRVKKAKELIDTGCLGKIFFIKIEGFYNKGDEYWEKGWSGRVTTDWRRSIEKSGGGVLIMNASHNIDYVHYLTGLKAESVVGYSDTYKKYKTDLEVEDTAIGIMRLNNGGLMQVTSLSSFPLNQYDTVVITGEKGAIEIGQSVKLCINEPFENYKVGEWNIIETDNSTSPYIGYFDAWADMQKNNSGVPVTGEDALYALKVVKEMYKNNRTK